MILGAHNNSNDVICSTIFSKQLLVLICYRHYWPIWQPCMLYTMDPLALRTSLGEYTRLPWQWLRVSTIATTMMVTVSMIICAVSVFSITSSRSSSSSRCILWYNKGMSVINDDSRSHDPIDMVDMVMMGDHMIQYIVMMVYYMIQ